MVLVIVFFELSHTNYIVILSFIGVLELWQLGVLYNVPNRTSREIYLLKAILRISGKHI